MLGFEPELTQNSMEAPRPLIHTIWHSKRGSQYTRYTSLYVSILRKRGRHGRMGSRRNRRVGEVTALHGRCVGGARAQHSGRSVRNRVESVYDGTNKEQRRRASATRPKGDTHQNGNTKRTGGAPSAVSRRTVLTTHLYTISRLTMLGLDPELT